MTRGIPYSRGLVIRNLAALPRGLRCRFLVCIPGERGELVAKRWARQAPRLEGSEVVVIFPD